MSTQRRSSTCSKTFTTSHTKSSETKPKVTLLTCLGTRLPAEREKISKRAVTRVFQCQMYMYLWQATHAEVSYSWIVHSLFGKQLHSQYTHIYIYICITTANVHSPTARLKYTHEWLEYSELILYITIPLCALVLVGQKKQGQLVQWQSLPTPSWPIGQWHIVLFQLGEGVVNGFIDIWKQTVTVLTKGQLTEMRDSYQWDNRLTHA